MDAKDVWPVVRFIVAATGLKREDARRYIDEIPQEKYGSLYLASRQWERDVDQKALEMLTGIVGMSTNTVLQTAVERARIPSHKQPKPGPRKRRK